MSKKVIIIGAGPAGLTAAYELLKQSKDFDVVVLEATNEIGGLSRTVQYHGNLIDVGGHRFITEIPEVKTWWEEMMPVQGALAYDDKRLNRQGYIKEGGPDPELTDMVMLRRNRLSRIFFKKRFFDYPISLNVSTIKSLGLGTTFLVGCSYVKSLVHKRPEKSLEDYYINQFGKKLYKLFFEKYTEELWGQHPRDISPEYGKQRVNDKISVLDAIKGVLSKDDVRERDDFYYPKLGPGQLWEATAEKIEVMGGKIIMNAKVVDICRNDKNKITGVVYKKNSKRIMLKGDYVISSMPLKDLTEALDGVPSDVLTIAEGLPYRDYITVAILVSNMALRNETKIKTLNNIVPDNWIYIHDKGVKMLRFQVYNNWSPYLVKEVDKKIWLGFEYFCNEGDELWKMTNDEIIKMAVDEMIKIGIVDDKKDILDCHVERVKKAYPAYFGTYGQISQLKDYLDKIPNLFLVGRNGQHKYNNMDHSMCTSFEAVKNIMEGVTDKSNIWAVNTEKDYNEKIV